MLRRCCRLGAVGVAATVVAAGFADACVAGTFAGGTGDEGGPLLLLPVQGILQGIRPVLRCRRGPTAASGSPGSQSRRPR